MDVALVGLGHMGTAIAERILDAGYALVVFNRTPAKAEALLARGATAAATQTELLRNADVCVTTLADDAALEAVALGEDGVLAGARAGTVLVDMSTVSTSASARVAGAASAAGVGFVRAPVSGNPVVVRAGNLTIMISAPARDYERVEPLLRAIGPHHFVVGEAEEARVVKLVLQVMVGGTAELMAEALLLGEAGGVSRKSMLEVMGASAAGSPFVKYKTPPLLADDYSATFTTSMLQKDLELVLDFAAESDAELPLTRLLNELAEAAIGAGYGEHDFMALLLALRERNAARKGT